jgi:hypothetical protein
MSSPLETVSPLAFKAVAGAPRCCDIETKSSPGRGSLSIPLSLDRLFLSAGCTPPLEKVALFNTKYTPYLLVT